MLQSYLGAGPSRAQHRAPHQGLLVLALCLVAVAAAWTAGCARTTDGSDRASPLASLGHSSEFDAVEGPIRPNTHLAAGRLAESRGDLATAAGQYRQVLHKQPEDREALFRLGVVLSKMRDAQAIDIWKRYIVVTKGSATGWANLGFCHEVFEERELAEAAYQKAIERDPNNHPARMNYGMHLAHRGEYAAAAVQLSHVLPPAQTWYNIGSVSEKQGKRDQAVEAYRRALELDPDLAAAQSRLLALTPAAGPAGRDVSTDG